MKHLLRRFITFLVRILLGVKDGEWFRFTNQKKTDIYFFDGPSLWKYENGVRKPSRASFNWLMDKECEINKIEK